MLEQLRNLWNLEVPFWVTRKRSDGTIGSWSVNALTGFVLVFLGLANILLWGVVGVKEAFECLT
jgi:hypothetical protein